MWLLRRAREVFGAEGYAAFRLALFCLFSAFAAWLAHALPAQSRLGLLSTAANVALVLMVFTLKSLVQVREGLAFLFVLGPAVGVYGHRRRGAPASGAGALAATALHAGAGIFCGVWIAALALPARRGVQRALAAAAVLAGGAAAWLISRHASGLAFALRDLGVDQSAAVTGSLGKSLYWLANGVLVMIIGRQVIQATAGMSRFAQAQATALVRLAAPALYGLCLTLVLTSFRIPSVTSMAIRVLFSVMELGLVIVFLRGRATPTSLAVALLMLADQARLLAA